MNSASAAARTFPERVVHAAASPLTWICLAAAISVLSLSIGDREPPSIPADFPAFYRQNQTAPTSATEGGEIVSWSFAAGVPGGWEQTGRSLVEPGNSTTIMHTGTQRFGYQLVGPTESLGAGNYEAIVLGRVLDGGLSVGVVDADSDQFLATSNYWSGQTFGSSSVMAVPFSLSRRSRVRMVLANWAARPYASEWSIGRVTFASSHRSTLPAPKPVPQDFPPYYEVHSSSFVRPPYGEPTASWSFAVRPPAGWSVDPDARFASGVDGALGVDVRTSRNPTGYQLEGPKIDLPAGRYVIVVDGEIVSGGMNVGAIDIATNRFIANGYFWSGNPPGPNESLGVSFVLREKSSLRLVLSNLAKEPFNSAWTVHRVEIRETVDAP